jgi:hypothetical protein
VNIVAHPQGIEPCFNGLTDRRNPRHARGTNFVSSAWNGCEDSNRSFAKREA